MKEELTGRNLIVGLPEELVEICTTIICLGTADIPEYNKYLSLIEQGLKKLAKGKFLGLGKGSKAKNMAKNTDVTDIIWNRLGREWIEKGQIMHTIKLRNSFPSFFVSRKDMEIDED